MKDLVLYSTDHCTLCDAALDLLLSMPELGGCSVRVVDVAVDDALLQRYGERIPVLAAVKERVEFTGPFERGRLSAWLGDLQ
ncbi:MAG: glutaredoxin family protein [Pseudomonadales bacterium]|nr:glutaredoxin family protein [Pseudomonadales bacterium]